MLLTAGRLRYSHVSGVSSRRRFVADNMTHFYSEHVSLSFGHFGISLFGRKKCKNEDSVIYIERAGIRGGGRGITMITVSDLEKLSEIKIEDVDTSGLVHAEMVEINYMLPAAVRMADYLEKIKNPYCFLCGEIPVKICFAEKEIRLGERLKDYFLSLKR